jgi:hypothetical protein
VKKRYLIALCVGLIWTVLGLVVLNGAFEQNKEAGIASTLENADKSWQREDLYYNLSRGDRGWWLVQRPQNGEETYPNKDRIRILLLGDSYVYGTGLRDFDRRLGDLLEEELNKKTKPGTFEVVTLAEGGASTYLQASWLASIEESGSAYMDDKGLQRVLEPFDALVLGYVNNDVVPLVEQTNPEEQIHKISEKIHLEVEQAGGKRVETHTKIEDEDYGRVLDRVIDNPNQDYFEASLRFMSKQVPDGMAVVLPLYTSQEELGASKLWFDVLEKNGFYVPKILPETDKLAESLEAQDLMITNVDRHPSLPLLKAYAIDAAEILYQKLDKAVIEKAMSGAMPSERFLLSNHLPYWAEVLSNDNTSAELVFKNEINYEEYCLYRWNNGNRLECDPEPTFVLREESVQIQNSKNTMFKAKPQVVPCLPLGKPFVQSMLNPDIASGTKISVDIQTEKPMDIYLVGYDEAGFERFDYVKTLKKGGEIEMVLGEHKIVSYTPSPTKEPKTTQPGTMKVSGIIMALADGSGCSLEEATSFPQYIVSFEIEK